MRRSFGLIVAAAFAVEVAGCADRDEIWDAPVGSPPSFELEGAAAIVDTNADRALLVAVDQDLGIQPVSVPIGRGFRTASATADRKRLLVLSAGDAPQASVLDQPPSLTVIAGTTSPAFETRYTLSTPLSGLAVDPQGEFAVLYANDTDGGFVENPNELVVVDLRSGGARAPVPLTLRSFGGRPQRFTFTPSLELPQGSSRLLVVETDRDIAILDLLDLESGDITVRLSSTGVPRAPAQVVISSGDPEGNDDARLAVRLDGESSVVIVDMEPSDGSAHGFRPTPNEVFVGGTPTDVGFVKTDGGLRLAALVPSRELLTLIDPKTGISSEVALGAPFDRLSIVTDVVGAVNGADVALVWSTESPSIAFVSLGSSVGKPYKSVDRLDLGAPISTVHDVPIPNERLKLLGSSDGTSFVVLDLLTRTAAPIVADSGTEVSIAPSGRHAWMVAPGVYGVAQLDLATLHPVNLALQNRVQPALDIARQGGGRALVAVHPVGTLGLTILDGEDPSLDNAVEYAGILLGGLR